MVHSPQRDRLLPRTAGGHAQAEAVYAPRMTLNAATETDYREAIDFVNLTFRGSSPTASCNVEAGIIGGPGIDESLLREELPKTPAAELLLHRVEPTGMLPGTVWLAPRENHVGQLGMEERRGYRLTERTERFPYGDERYGRPLRNDLSLVVLERNITAPTNGASPG
jgi:hypothetical protein